ncbi:TIGR03790 family protein [Luteolibacter luteus]|uniref:TIGR03790 family protein n=1 Tax=Luteolibacter luteus TaxID=2728835 RepID=A0A858RL30_9BACT|nr:TIGR03790 family protein [Luteolibacter luteus]QJE97552.1 TIGR03790 family protein [Luteolibacter luteus]
MIRILGFLLSFTLALKAAPAPLDVESVAILYNSSSRDSKSLAEYYAGIRKIPEENLIGLPLPDAEEMSRADFEKLLKAPLVKEYDLRKWWTRSKSAEGQVVPLNSKIRVLVCMRGVPSRVAADPTLPMPKPEDQAAYLQANQAAVDSELALLGMEGLPIKGALNNPYYKVEKSIAETGLPMTLVGRIDSPSLATCERMIRDAVETEKTGLWGMAVIDFSKKFAESPEGDPALENIVRYHREAGIPTMADRFPETLPLNYPLRDTAIYFGWYDWNVSGPFLNTTFKFKKGAVAAHLHSFSAAQLRDPAKNWVAPLLTRGAAATLGNVYEPFLQMTHHFDIFEARLMAGYSLVEAAYMALPVLSWQNIVVGDPLYRPFLHLDGSGELAEEDRAYRAIRIAKMRWKDDPAKYEEMLRTGATSLKSGPMMEAVGLMNVEQHKTGVAAMDFQKAKLFYTSKPDRLRLDMHIAAMDRAAGRNAAAVKLLRGAQTLNLDIPEVSAPATWLNILEPPAPKK